MPTSLTRLAAALVVVATPLAARADATVSSADRAFVAKVSQGGMYEVAAGTLAETRGSRADVRDLGTTEAHDHALVGAKLTSIADSLGIAHGTKLNASFSAKLANLRAMHGAAFDQAFVTSMDEVHDGDGAAFAAEATGGENPDLRAFAAETHRIVERHLGALHAVAP